MATAIGASSGQDRTLAKQQQGKLQLILKQQQAQVDQYQVPFVGQCSPYPNSFAPPPPPPLFHQPAAAYQQHQMTNGRHHLDYDQQQQRLNGAHTISRSKDLHKHYGSQQAVPMKTHPAQLVYYDQPYLGYGGSVAGAGPPILATNGGPYAAVSLAVRVPKERGSIPAALVGGAAGGGTVGPAFMRHYAADLYQQRPHKGHSTKQLIYQEQPASLLDLNARFNKPLCRCRVMYLGSSVPHITKNGLHGIQEPLRHLYPEEKFSTDSLRKRTQQQQQSMTIDISHLSSSLGIDSWLSVWSNGLLLENVDEFGRDIKRFFSIESLHYCAAVRYFDTTTLMGERQPVEPTDPNNNTGQESVQLDDQDQHENQLNNRQQQKRAGVVRFLPLDAPIFQYPNMMDANHPPVFAAILRRTTGIKVLECHAFICRRDAASNALVRCCTHAYADFLSAKRMSAEFGVNSTTGSAAMSSHYNGGASERRSSRTSDQRDDQSRTRLANQRRGRQLNETLNHQRNQVVASGQEANGKEHSQLNGGSSTLARRRNAQEDQRRRPARSLSTGGTNSQEMTHSDENSPEVDSEDNYAIISRHCTTSLAKLNSAKENSADDSAGSHRRGAAATNGELDRRGRKSKGSSKSLFRSFMPNELLADDRGSIARGRSSGHRSQQRGADQSAAEFVGEQAGSRLSHSLDQLRAGCGGFGANCCQGAECLGGLAGGNHELSATRDSVKYSIVANKQRRYSKSMQQLVNVTGGQRQQEANQGQSISNGPVSFAWHQSMGSRRAASCQDIAHDGSLSRASSCSGRRRPSQRSQRRRSESRRSSMSSLHRQQNSIARSQTKLSVSGHKQDQLQQQRARQLDQSGYIYATCNESPPPTLIRPLSTGELGPVPMPVRILRADCCVPTGKVPTGDKCPVDSSSSSGSVRTKRSSKLIKHQQQHQQMQPNSLHVQQDPLGGYYQFMQPPPPLGHRTSCYSPTGTALMYCGPAPNHHQPIYGLPPPPPLPPHVNAPSPSHVPAYYLSPSQHQQQQYPPPTLFHPAASPLYNGAPASMLAPNGYVMANGPQTTAGSKSSTMKRPNTKSSGASTKDSTMKRDSKLACKSQTLANRFRCLSPPLSFLTGGSGGDRNSSASRSNPTQGRIECHDQMARADQASEQFENQLDQNNNRQSVASTSSRTTTGSSEQMSPGQIVSGRPGFLATASNGSNSNGKPPAQQVVPAQSQRDAPNSGRPKMSWIKRLSLTLSSGSATAQPRQHPSGKATRTVDPLEQTSIEIYRNIQEAGQQQGETLNNDTIQTRDSNRDQAGRDADSSDPQATHSEQLEGGEDKLIGEQNEQLETGQSQAAESRETKDTKRKQKKGGFFSGSLTLGRRSRVKSKP